MGFNQIHSFFCSSGLTQLIWCIRKNEKALIYINFIKNLLHHFRRVSSLE
ncbi:hypothetical protein FDUTEX481_05205 [Tolypothrix sp. PCC 7601]|nr:hypothetical protein FDUTEX481_05205 [Tolypothrix sp. PCC 7601]